MTQVATTGDALKFIELAQPRYKYGTLTVKTGKVYHKILSETPAQRSAYAFIDHLGNIYKASSWAKPAKGIRGNIFSESKGLEALDAEGFIRYLR